MPTLEVRLEPVPDRRRERGLRAPPVRVPHGPARLQPAPARDDPVPAQLGRLRVRPGADRPGRRGRRPRRRRDRRPDALLRRGELGRVPAERRLRPVDAAGRRPLPAPPERDPALAASCSRRPRPASPAPPEVRLLRSRLGRAALGLAHLGDRDRARRPVGRRRRGVADAQDRAAALDRGPARVRDRSTSCCARSAGACCWRRSRRSRSGRRSPRCSVGYLANNVLPARLGEVVRATTSAGARRCRGRRSSGTIVIERVVDTFVVVAIASVAILVLSVRGIVASAVLVGLARDGAAGRGRGRGDRRAPAARRRAGRRVPRALAAGARRRSSGCARGSRSRATRARSGSRSRSRSRPGRARCSRSRPRRRRSAWSRRSARRRCSPPGTNLATAIPAGPGYIGTFELAVVTIAASVGIDREAGARVRAARPPRDAARDVGRRRDRADLRRTARGSCLADEARLNREGPGVTGAFEALARVRVT